MSEIEKMYKLANVKAINITKNGSTCIPDNIQISGHLYPPFTAEKQLELIKWLAKNLLCSHLDWLVSCCDNFEEGLAALINTLWQDLTEEEKQQVKGILR